MNSELIITNIQHFCLHDGPGLRTTVFFKGCSIHCPWCANPETISNKIQYYIDRDICKSNNNKTCKYSGVCYNVNKKNVEKINCELNAIKSYGYVISSQNLYDELIKDKNFFEGGGGVTFSGGEPLLQIRKYEDVLKKLKEEKIGIIFETALFVPMELLKIAKKYTNDFIVDIKILNKEQCKKVLGGNINIYLENLDFLFSNQANIVFRIPLSNEYTFTEDNKILILKLLKRYKPSKVEIFKLHSLAKNKYSNLNLEFKKFNSIEESSIDYFMESVRKIGIDIELLKI